MDHVEALEGGHCGDHPQTASSNKATHRIDHQAGMRTNYIALAEELMLLGGRHIALDPKTRILKRGLLRFWGELEATLKDLPK